MKKLLVKTKESMLWFHDFFRVGLILTKLANCLRMTKNFPPKKRKAGNWWNDKKRNLWKPFLIGPCPIKGLADTFMMWGRTDSNLEVCTIGETTGQKASIAGKMSVMIFPMEDFSLNLEDFIPSIISGNFPQNTKNVVKGCHHSSNTVQMSLQFDDFFFNFRANLRLRLL